VRPCGRVDGGQRGGRVDQQEVVGQVAGAFEGAGGRVGEEDALTDREREVLTLVADGLTNDEIARHLYISPGTAKTHVRHLLTKLDARDRVQLAIIAHRTGLEAPGTPIRIAGQGTRRRLPSVINCWRAGRGGFVGTHRRCPLGRASLPGVKKSHSKSLTAADKPSTS
jgi:DNA-binding CsgD family transcriptional regulator